MHLWWDWYSDIIHHSTTIKMVLGKIDKLTSFISTYRCVCPSNIAKKDILLFFDFSVKGKVLLNISSKWIQSYKSRIITKQMRKRWLKTISTCQTQTNLCLFNRDLTNTFLLYIFWNETRPHIPYLLKSAYTIINYNLK